jgi:uncharacterized protein YukE
MAKLDIVPEHVHHAATVGRAHHEELAGTYVSTHSQVVDAKYGWVGRSGSALSSMLDQWHSDAGEHHTILNHHHDGLQTAACAFVDGDENRSEDLRL